MPTYVYACSAKDHGQIEVVHKMTEDPLVPCPVCDEPMHRVPQKGGGFYQNPVNTLMDWCDRNWRYIRAGSKKRFSPDLVMRPDNPLPLRRERVYAHKSEPNLTHDQR